MMGCCSVVLQRIAGEAGCWVISGNMDMGVGRWMGALRLRVCARVRARARARAALAPANECARVLVCALARVPVRACVRECAALARLRLRRGSAKCVRARLYGGGLDTGRAREVFVCLCERARARAPACVLVRGVCACVRVWVRACVRACVSACVRERV